ncbi:unnamed protein product [Darwinula stevensoni]|uniref:Class II aldolase/adducin N-terminal domain-containing protein n=1 Tax=Darwinula stevensoni TaxID=69355 RepID=A0A7R8XAH0_9CRUS|nr:unnamed protein product [Darwinula stevensoni]CAG0890263.1 unnamed protein product [Darwinula stevensoni]
MPCKRGDSIRDMLEEGGVTMNGPNSENPPDYGMDEDEETKRMKMRPPDIDADVREMERRKRVDLIMNSRAFRDELERIIEEQIKEGYTPASLVALQQLYDLSALPGRFGAMSTGRCGAGSIIPIADIRGIDCFSYAKGEKLLRCKLASVYRLVDLFGWSQGIYNHITLRTSQDQEHFLINPFGLQYHEVTASSLVKVDMQGNVIDPGTTNFGINLAGFMLHSSIHAARPDIKCILHLHTPSVVAVSSLKCGLLPVSQEACLVGDVSYHEYQGLVVDPSEKESIARDLGPVNKVMLLRNHGAVCCGESVEEAFYNTYHLVLACDSQLKLMPVGVENLVLISEEAQKTAYEQSRRTGGAGGVDSNTSKADSSLNTSGEGGTVAGRRERKWRVGEMEYEALMRMLDNSGYRTGYMYKQPLVRAEPHRHKSDVEVPPSSSSYTYIFDEEDLFKFSPLKKILEGRKNADRSRWLNSPNVYQKVEVLETGTNDPKKITKWVAESSPTHGTPIKVEDPLQFVPKNTDPREFRHKQRQIKENRRAGGVSAGPQSNVLEGISWEEARKMQEGALNTSGDQVVMVGAASKGIIQRGYQHNAVVFRAPYAKNPFDAVTDEELEEYRRIVERRQRGEPIEDEDPATNQDSSMASQLSPPTSPIVEDTTPRVLTLETKVAPSPGRAEKQILSSQVHAGFHLFLIFLLLASVSLSACPMPDEPHVQHMPSVSEEDPQNTTDGEVTMNGDDHDGRVSHSSKEGSPSKDVSTTEESSRTEKKKKKKGIRTPSFLKKKKDKKKGAGTECVTLLPLPETARESLPNDIIWILMGMSEIAIKQCHSP